MACLDTTFILDLRGRGGANLQSRARTTLHQLIQTGQAITTTRINVAELYVGVERSHDPTRELAILSSILSTVEILEVDERSVRQFGRASAHLLRIGRPVGDVDALIGAIATVNEQTLFTRNPRHFADIPGLSVETY